MIHGPNEAGVTVPGSFHPRTGSTSLREILDYFFTTGPVPQCHR